MILIFSVVLLAQGITAGSPAESLEAAKRIIARMAEAPLGGLWELSSELASMGEDAVTAVEDGLLSPSVKVKLGCAQALLVLGEPEEAEKALRGIVDSKEDSEYRIAALRLLRRSLDEDLVPVLNRIAEEDPDPLVRIEAARTLWEVAEDTKAPKLLQRFLESDDRRLRIKAALALGEIGYVEGLTKRILVRLSQEPTPEGQQAALILEVERLAREGAASVNPFKLEKEALLKEKQARIEELERQIKALKQKRFGQEKGDPLLSWIWKMIWDRYVDITGLTEEKLRIGAAKGTVSALDRFSSFMDPQETKQFTESITGTYTGIGAQVAQDRDTGILTILRPLAGGPAREAGLKPHDQIIEIDGVPTKGKPMMKLVRLLKGEPGTQVRLKIRRRGWKKPREFVITRRPIKIETMHYRLLPGDIAYLRPDNFGETTYAEVRQALDSLKRKGMQGIILDLRGNPGGLLSAAVKVVDLFIASDPRPIVRQKGRIGVKEEMSHDEPPQYLSEPLVILVDKSSASASEIVAGALQDFDHRAILVGEKTFGKGSVQRIFSVPPELTPLVGGRSALRLTVQYYYLPSGRCIHTRRSPDGAIIEEGGVKPDIEVSRLDIPLWKSYEFEVLSENEAFKQYVRKLMEDRPENANREKVRLLLENGDGGDPYRYPGFKEFYASIKDHTRLKPEDVRMLLRAELRRAYEDSIGRELACDFQDDVQLRRAIVEVLKRLNVDPKSIAAYRSFPEARESGKSEGTARAEAEKTETDTGKAEEAEAKKGKKEAAEKKAEETVPVK